MSITSLDAFHKEFDKNKASQALDMLVLDRKNEFHELALVLLHGPKYRAMEGWREFVLNFCLDVDKAFQTWSGQQSLLPYSPQKALTILRQLSRDKVSMNQMVHLLNISYTLSAEFKEIYRRLK